MKSPPLNGQQFERMLQKARQTDAERTAMEHENGLGSPADGGFEILLRTSKDALECAIKCRDWQIACEAYVFLQQALGLLIHYDQRPSHKL